MKFRLTIWAMALAVIALLLYQNRDFYMGEQILSLNLFFAHWETPPVAHATQVLIAFLAGLLLASISLYHERFRLRRQLKKQTVAFQSCAQQVTERTTAECSASGKKGFKLPGLLRKKGAKPDRTQPGEALPAESAETGTAAS